MTEQAGDPKMHAAGLLGAIGGLLAKRGSVIDVRPIIREGTHEIDALRVTVHSGHVLVVRVEPDE